MSTTDPLADQRDWLSPYNYVQNNPLLRVDPDGRLDVIDIEKGTGKMSVTEAKGDDVVRLIDVTGKVHDSYTYGTNGSFKSETTVEEVDHGTNVTFAQRDAGSPDKAEKFYKFAAQSGVEYAKLDVKSPSGRIESTVTTSHGQRIVKTITQLVADYTKKGFEGIKLSHSHPSGNSIPSGHYGEETGNPYSLMPVPKNSVHDRGDSKSAREMRRRPGFGNTKFEVYNPRSGKVTSYDGVHRAIIEK
ncbi:hypothetical protein IMPR6_80032 [Imperialibacter sp. EC-SDR9]|nr:hypothetical protein IMPERIA75_200032 [Imperialibacter sp. 75]CAD5262242.1 hypothetical protein IMPERIA89_290032 [Imperialibacter sp. 89]VVT35214.1 hypothetical protein IMPR6_80032 [Imperialibacter sp. EC-SDR9]